MRRLAYLLGLLVASVCLANVIRVPEEYGTIQEAIDNAIAGDWVVVDNEFESGPITIAKSVTLMSYNYFTNQETSWARLTDINLSGEDSLSVNICGFFQYGNITLEQNQNYGTNVKLAAITNNTGFYRTFINATRVDLLLDKCSINYCDIEHRLADLTILNSDLRPKSKFIQCHHSNVIIDHCYIHDNDWEYRTNLINLGFSTCVVKNSTISDCRTTWFGGLINVTNFSSLLVENSIIYNISFDSNPTFPYIFWSSNYPDQVNSELNVEYSLIQGGSESIVSTFIEYLVNYDNNIDEDPLFSMRPRISSSSPCIDAGDPNSPLDPDGTRADIGAYYFCQGEGITLSDIVRISTEPGYPEPISATLQSTCDPVAIDSARTETGLFTLDSYPSQVPGEFQSGDFQLTFHPSAQGVFTDTLHIWADTDPPHHKIPLVGESGPIPAPVTDLSISILPDLSAQLTWSPVTQTIYGNPVTPDYYLIFYNEDNPANEDDWYYLYPVTSTTFTHPMVAHFVNLMNYRVVAWKGIDPALLGWEEGMKMVELEGMKR